MLPALRTIAISEFACCSLSGGASWATMPSPAGKVKTAQAPASTASTVSDQIRAVPVNNSTATAEVITNSPAHAPRMIRRRPNRSAAQPPIITQTTVAAISAPSTLLSAVGEFFRCSTANAKAVGVSIAPSRLTAWLMK